MSLRLCVLRAELAEHGFRFCMESLEAKLEKQKEIPAEEQTGATDSVVLLCF